MLAQPWAIILATLLEAAPADVRAEFKHLGSCVLGDLAAAQAGALLEGLSSDRQGLWTACKNAGISRKQGGISLQQEELRALVKDKLLAVLPAVSFQALLEHTHTHTRTNTRTHDHGAGFDTCLLHSLARVCSRPCPCLCECARKYRKMMLQLPDNNRRFGAARAILCSV